MRSGHLARLLPLLLLVGRVQAFPGDICALLLIAIPLLESIWFLVVAPDHVGGSGPPLLRWGDRAMLPTAHARGARRAGAEAPAPGAAHHDWLAPVPAGSGDGRAKGRTQLRAAAAANAAPSKAPTRPPPTLQLAPRASAAIPAAASTAPRKPTLGAAGRPVAPAVAGAPTEVKQQPMSEGFPNIMYPLVRPYSDEKQQTPYQSSRQGFLRGIDSYVQTYQGVRAKLRSVLQEMTWLKTNPLGMEALNQIIALASPGYAINGQSASPHWQVIAEGIKAAEPYLRRIQMIRQIFGDPPYSFAPNFVWAGQPAFNSVDMDTLSDNTGGFS